MLNKLQLHIIGMDSEERKDGGRALVITYSFELSPWGELLLAATMRGVCYVAFVATDRETALEELKQRFPNACYRQALNDYLIDILQILRVGESTLPLLPLHVAGTDFQLEVWRALLAIPFGGTTSYGALAAKLSRPKACRAVGSAVGFNPVAVIIPCHRVLPVSGGLGGYRWGEERKRRLLDEERECLNGKETIEENGR